MNPLAIETAFKTALAVSFPTAVVHAGTSYEEIPPETTTLVISAASVDHVAGGLHKASVSIRVVSPALIGSDSFSELDATLSSLTSALSPATLSTNWPTDPGTPAFGGIWITVTRTSQEGNAWAADVETVLGVSE